MAVGWTQRILSSRSDRRVRHDECLKSVAIVVDHTTFRRLKIWGKGDAAWDYILGAWSRSRTWCGLLLLLTYRPVLKIACMFT